jgi:hypothetical protein
MSQQIRRLLSCRSLSGALRRALVPGVSALVLASSGVASADLLEPVRTPVAKTIEAITAPVTGSPPSAPSVSTPPPVTTPAPVKTPSVKIPPVKVPVELPHLPVKLPATPSLEPVTSVVEPTATSPVASPTLPKTVASAQDGVETVAEGASTIVGEVTKRAGAARESGAPAQRSREAPTEALPDAAAAAAAENVDPVQRLVKTARVAPLEDWFVRIWPAVALGRSTLDVFLGGWPQIALRILERGGAATFGANGANDAGGGSGSGDDGLGDLASSVDLPGPGRWFVPETPLPLAVVYIALAGGLGAVWYLSRREVGLRTASRRRRL